MTPIIFSLRMNFRIAIDFTGRSLENFRAVFLSQVQHMKSTEHAGLRCTYRIRLVMDGRSGASKVVDLINLGMKRIADIVLDELECRIL